MELQKIIDTLDCKYYESIQLYLNKYSTEPYINIDWLDAYIDDTNRDLQYDINTETEKKKEELNNLVSQETDNHNQIFSDEQCYIKPWVKLNSIHKILKIKEFVNNLQTSEENRKELKDELVELVKTKILTKKEHVKYDEVNGKVISLTNLKYNNNKYYYNIEKY